MCATAVAFWVVKGKLASGFATMAALTRLRASEGSSVTALATEMALWKQLKQSLAFCASMMPFSQSELFFLDLAGYKSVLKMQMEAAACLKFSRFRSKDLGEALAEIFDCRSKWQPIDPGPIAMLIDRGEGGEEVGDGDYFVRGLFDVLKEPLPVRLWVVSLMHWKGLLGVLSGDYCQNSGIALG